MLMRSTALRMVNNVEVIRDIVVEGELAEVGLKLDQNPPARSSLSTLSSCPVPPRLPPPL